VISPQRRREIIDALRRGTVPQRGLDTFAVGTDRFAAAFDDDLRDPASGRIRLELRRPSVRQQRDVRMLQRRANAQHLGVGLRVQRAGEAVAVPASNADAVGRGGLVTQDPAGSVEGVMAGGREVVRELLDPRLVRECRERIRRTRGWIGRILAPCSPDLVELLGLRVVRLHVRVVDRPGG